MWHFILQVPVCKFEFFFASFSLCVDTYAHKYKVYLKFGKIKLWGRVINLKSSVSMTLCIKNQSK